MTRAAIQGERGAFSHAAARSALGGDGDPEIVACRSFEELFDAVVNGDADVGVLPVENTLAGSVQRALDLLASQRLFAVAEVAVPIRLCLVVKPGVQLEEVRSAASHPVALEQCLRFFRDHPEVERRVAYDTAGSVRDLMSGQADYDAAIGSELSAELYGGHVLLRGLEDHAGNFTRFLVVSRTAAAPPEADAKTSLVFTVKHRPGSLHTALGCFTRHQVDLTRLESRPIPGRPWEYRFYADLRGAPPERQENAIAELRAHSEDVRVLGCYAEAVLPT